MKPTKRKVGRPKSSENMVRTTIRLEAELISSLKRIAAVDRLPYQTYLRRVLWKDVSVKEGELK